jgi:hypothetical protein
MSVENLVSCALAGIERDRLEIRPGLSNMLKLMSRLAPTPNPATGSLRATALPERPASLRMHFEHDVVLARVLDHFQAEIVVRPYLGRRRMINLEGLDLLAEIGGVPADVDHIANAQRTGLEPDGRD